MCGRYVVARTLSGAMPDLLTDLEGWSGDFENFNIPPSTDVPIVVSQLDTTHAVSHRRSGLAHWGFVPVWKKTFEQRPQPINARIETVATNGMFRHAFRRGHCIIPASGYVEWRVDSLGKKHPHYIHSADGSGLAMAGLFEDWVGKGPSGEPDRVRRTMAILTRDAVGPARAVHDRMPVLLPPDEYDFWLDTSSHHEASAVIDELMTASEGVAGTLVTEEVDARIGNVRNNGPHLIVPVKASDAKS